jgi:hypothetical protein
MAASAGNESAVSSTHQQVSRRSVLGAGALAGVLLAGGVAGVGSQGIVRAAAGPIPVGQRRRVLRFAHPTDIHVQPELRGGEGMAQALSHMMSLSDPPALVINGGDSPMDSGSSPYERSKTCWDLFLKTWNQCIPARVPSYHVIGNHDIFGRNKEKSKATGTEAYYGRRWFCDNFGYDRTYRSFDAAGWHFVLLDDINLLPNGDDYVPSIDDQEMEWLKADLASNKLPTVVVTHIPILTVTVLVDRDNVKYTRSEPYFEVESARMHQDCKELEQLFRENGNVKLCLSGHIHILDRCTYNGITYICDGAVSSNKWKGTRLQTPNGYGLIDLYSDGTFDHQYNTFGWTT